MVSARSSERGTAATPELVGGPRRPWPLAPRFAAATAVGSGVAGAYAFPQVGIWPLAILSVAGLSIAVHGQHARRAAWLGYLYGLAFFMPLLHWTSIFVGSLPWLILALAEAAFCALLGAVLSVVQRLPWRPFWVGTAWVLQEALRDRLPFGGFPWGRLAFSQSESPLRWVVALGGQPLLTFAVAVLGGALASVVLTIGVPDRRRREVATAVIAAAVVVLCAPAASLTRPATSGDRTATIAVVQGSVPDIGLEFETRAREVLDNHVKETMRLAQEIRSGAVQQPQLVVWPENSSDVDPLTDASAAAEISAAAEAVRAPILVGAILDGPGANHRRNAGILWSPVTGPGAEYIKRHPVPFAEYIPLRSIARLVSPDVNLVTQDMVGGHSDGLLRGAPFLVGDVICFEVAYDDLVRSSVLHGAKLVVVQSNNATFGHTSETYQQLAMTRLRAIEHARTTVQSTTTGKSAIIAPDGSTMALSGALYQPDILVADVPLVSAQTLATRLGSLPELVLAALAVVGVVLGVVRRRRVPTDAEIEEP